MIDSHCHLDSSAFDDASEVLTRAKAAGLTQFVVVGVGKTLAQAQFAVRLAEERSDVVAAVGVHPHDASMLSEEMFAELRTLATHPRVCAIGEMGLDYHYNHSPKEAQKDAFRRQIALAREVRKPIVVHTREAPEDTLTVLAEEGARDVGGVIHCFSEDRPFASRALDLGFDLSFSGIVTFKSAVPIHDVAAWAPLDRIHIETDSPYLAPVPLRGKTCEPAFLVHTARRVAALRGVTFEAIATQTAENTRRLFGFARA